jgi:aryl sulfotransferase
MVRQGCDIHVLQNGVPRSGNVWLFYLTRHLLEAAGVDVKQYIAGTEISKALGGEDLGISRVAESDFLVIEPLRCFYTVLDAFRWPVEDIDDYVSQTTQVASHSAWGPASAEVYGKFSHVWYIIRDPRDVALSVARFGFTPYNLLHRPHGFKQPGEYLDHHFNQLMQSWVSHVAGHLGQIEATGLHILFYEQLVADLHGKLQEMAERLGLTLTPEQLEQVAKANSFGRISEQQPHHTHKGIWGDWRTQLSKVQVRRADEIAGPMLQLLGYPPDLHSAQAWSPDTLRLP